MASIAALTEQITSLTVRDVANAAHTASGTHADFQATGPPAASSVAGIELAVQTLRELIGWPLQYRQAGKELGVRWLKGVLLHGPPGCGKTLLVNAVAAEYGAKVHSVLASNIFGAYTGESEEKLRNAFKAAAEEAAAGAPVVVFLDEVDALCPRRGGGQPHESRVVAQLLTLLDGASQRRETSGHLIVVAATNRPNAIDPALRRPGRLDREIAIPVPDAQARREILGLQTGGMPLAGEIDLDGIAASAVGYSGADLASLCREAAMLAIADDSSSPSVPTPEGSGVGETAVAKIFQRHFLGAMIKVRPSITRGAEMDITPARWEDIGGLHEVKRRLKQAVEWPLKHADAFQRLGIAPPRGVLLHGPPGCSKTTLARAAATASGASFQALAGTQLYSAYLGEGEATLRVAFARARAAAPAIIFFDELDALAGNRGSIGEGQKQEGGPGVRLLSALLTEMDGMELAKGVLVLGATNRPMSIDPALLRPGRFDVHLFVPPPDAEGRLEALQIHSRSMPLAADVQLESLAAKTEGFTGAELEAICREAALAALRENLETARETSARHFEAALSGMKPGLGPEELLEYQNWQNA